MAASRLRTGRRAPPLPLLVLAGLAHELHAAREGPVAAAAVLVHEAWRAATGLTPMPAMTTLAASTAALASGSTPSTCSLGRETTTGQGAASRGG